MLKRYAVIGFPLGHTMSPFIHKRLFELSKIEATYEAILTPPGDLKATVERLKGYDGFNITIPHKEAVIPLIDATHKSADIYGAVNTVKVEKGRLIGFSTDADGFTEALKLRGIPLRGRVLVLGCGGASRTIATECALRGLNVTFAVLPRSVKKAKAVCDEIYERFSRKASYILFDDLDNIEEGFDLAVNGTPVGMYPNPDASPLTDSQLKNISCVFDAVYNPLDTLLVKKAGALGKKAISGMDMLVLQAVKAHFHWYGGSFSPKDILRLIEDAGAEMKRLFATDFAPASTPASVPASTPASVPDSAPKSIILCGFMGSGKTVTGKALAKALNAEFIDLDKYIEDKEGMSVKDIFSRFGEEYFRTKETEACSLLGGLKGKVIALGGGTVINPKNRELLKAEGNKIYLLSVTPETVKARLKRDSNRPLLSKNKDEAIDRLFKERENIYLSSADFVIESNSTVENSVEQILKIHKENN